MKYHVPYPVIDVKRTGENIHMLRELRGLSVAEVQHFFGFSDPQAIYQWQRGVNLPSVDHLCALSKLLDVTVDQILILRQPDSPSHTPRPGSTVSRYTKFLLM